MIEVEKLRKQFGDLPAVDDIEFQARPGEIFGLLGPTGWASLCASLGLLLGNEATTEGQAVAAGVLASNLLAALGGCWWPIEITPAWAQTLAKFLPTGWAMDALHRLVSFESGSLAAAPHAAGMFLAALLVGWAGARRFRFQ